MLPYFPVNDVAKGLKSTKILVCELISSYSEPGEYTLKQEASTGKVPQDWHTPQCWGTPGAQIMDIRQGGENGKQHHSLGWKLKAKGKLVFSWL